MQRLHYTVYLIVLLFLGACKKPVMKPTVDTPKLPYMGTYDLVEKTVDGKTVVDTVFNTIPAFSFTNQDGQILTEKNYQGKVYIADFFFTTCSSICPKMTNTLTLVQQKLKGEKDFAILSHSIDPEYDTPEILKSYAQKNQADTRVWNFVTGDKEKIYDICENHYMAYAKEDSLAEGGYIHSGFLILVDKNRFVRGAYDGTRPEMADSIAADVKRLLNEN